MPCRTVQCTAAAAAATCMLRRPPDARCRVCLSQALVPSCPPARRAGGAPVASNSCLSNKKHKIRSLSLPWLPCRVCPGPARTPPQLALLPPALAFAVPGQERPGSFFSLLLRPSRPPVSPLAQTQHTDEPYFAYTRLAPRSLARSDRRSVLPVRASERASGERTYMYRHSMVHLSAVSGRELRSTPLDGASREQPQARTRKTITTTPSSFLGY